MVRREVKRIQKRSKELFEEQEEIKEFIDNLSYEIIEHLNRDDLTEEETEILEDLLYKI